MLLLPKAQLVPGLVSCEAMEQVAAKVRGGATDGESKDACAHAVMGLFFNWH